MTKKLRDLKKKMTDNGIAFAAFIVFMGTVSGLLWQVWEVQAQVAANSAWITEEKYDRTLWRIEQRERKCGEKAVKCSAEKQKELFRWKRKLKKLEVELGYRSI